MEIDVASESKKALMEDSTLRCLFEAQYTLSSRHSSKVIPFARDLVTEFTDALIEHIAEDAKQLDVVLNVVTLRRKKRLFICCDIFLQGCEEEVRDTVDKAVDRPIHKISEENGVYHLKRAPVWDQRVRLEYGQLKGFDKGPRPYFFDSANPTFYDDGIRIEPDLEAEV